MNNIPELVAFTTGFFLDFEVTIHFWPSMSPNVSLIALHKWEVASYKIWIPVFLIFNILKRYCSPYSRSCFGS